MTLHVHIDDGNVRRYLHQFAARGQRPPLRRIAVIMQASVSRNFEAGGRPQPWPPLRPGTIAGRRFGGDRPLQDTGALKKSVQQQIFYPDNVAVYTKHEHAAYHQFGTRPYVIRPRRPGGVLRFPVGGRGGRGQKEWRSAREVRHPGLPARPFVMWQNEDVRLIEKTLLDFLLDGR